MNLGKQALKFSPQSMLSRVDSTLGAVENSLAHVGLVVFFLYVIFIFTVSAR